MLICVKANHEPITRICTYTLSNFEIGCDVIAYLRRATQNLLVVHEIVAKHAHFRVARSEARNLPWVTSHLILKLDREYRVTRLKLSSDKGCMELQVSHIILSLLCDFWLSLNSTHSLISCIHKHQSKQFKEYITKTLFSYFSYKTCSYAYLK